MTRNPLEAIGFVHLTWDGTNYALSGGTTDVNSGALDALGFSTVAFLAVFGDNLDTGTFTGKIQGSADGSTNWTDISSATYSFTAGASDTDNKMLGIGCAVNPSYRYYRFVTDRGTANTVGACLLGLLGMPVYMPVTQLVTTGNFIAQPVIV